MSTTSTFHCIAAIADNKFFLFKACELRRDRCAAAAAAAAAGPATTTGN
jgi:hypothetical protein